MMYEHIASLQLQGLSQGHLPRLRYESEDEEISGSETGGHDITFSPVDSHKALGAFESDLSVDEASSMDSEPDIESTSVPQLLPSPFSIVKGSRPVSLDTIKRSSGTTCVPEPFRLDDDDRDVLDFTSADSPLQSPMFLQPTVYVPPQSPRSIRTFSFRSPSPASIFSDDGTEPSLLVAEEVMYIEPKARPNLVSLVPLAPSLLKRVSISTTSKASERSNRSQERQEQEDSLTPLPGRPIAGELVMSKQLPAPKFEDRKETTSDASINDTVRSDLGGNNLDSIPTSATITCLSEIPVVPQSVPSRIRSTSFSRPWTSTSDRPSSRARRPTEAFPAAPLRNTSSSSLPYYPSRSASPYPSEDGHSHSMSVSHVPSPLRTSRPSSRTSSNASNYCAYSPLRDPPLRDRSASVYSASSNHSAHTHPFIRNSIMKHSADPRVQSTSSLRSEVEIPPEPAVPSGRDQSAKQQKVNRRRSLRRLRPSKDTDVPEQPNRKSSFMGFKLPKKSSTLKKSPP